MVKSALNVYNVIKEKKRNSTNKSEKEDNEEKNHLTTEGTPKNKRGNEQTTPERTAMEQPP